MIQLSQRTITFQKLLILSLVSLNFFDPMSISLKAGTLKSGSLPTITVIIDDVGDNQRLGYRAAKLPANIALSILPHTPFSQELAIIGHNSGKDILLHQPMESLNDVRLLGPGALLGSMDRPEFSRILENNLKAVPYVVGINNHMGSLLTADQEKMNWLMAELKPRAIFFIDSRTTSKSIAENTAQRWNIPTMSRKIFLDHFDQPEAIAEQFQRLLQIAEKYGHATAIGHPRQNTLQFLEINLPQLINTGFKLVAPSEVMRSNVDSIQSVALTMPVLMDISCNKLMSNHRFKILRLHTMKKTMPCAD